MPAEAVFFKDGAHERNVPPSSYGASYLEVAKNDDNSRTGIPTIRNGGRGNSYAGGGGGGYSGGGSVTS